MHIHLYRGAPVALAVVLAAIATPAHAGSLLYTFGGDFISPGATGVPDSLNRMDAASAASVTNVRTPVGDGSVGFNGGLVFANDLLYTIGNDSNGFATLYSLQPDGLALATISSDFNTTGDAAGVIFQNGLTAVGSTFYAIGAGAGGEGLYQIGSGSAAFTQGLPTLGGTYTGLAWDPALGLFYAVIAGANGSDFHGDFLVRFGVGGPFSIVAQLTALDGAEIGTHLGGLADAGGGILYDIYTNPATLTGQLERITVGGTTVVSTLYDTQVPLAQNAGIAIAASVDSPEPATSVEFGCGLTFAAWFLKRRKK